MFSVDPKPGPIKHKPKGKHTESVLRGPVAFSSVGERFQAWNLETLSNDKNCIAGELKRILASPWLNHQNCRLAFLPMTPCKAFCIPAGEGDCRGWGACSDSHREGEVALSQVSHSPVRYGKGTESIHLKEVLVLKDQR